LSSLFFSKYCAIYYEILKTAKEKGVNNLILHLKKFNNFEKLRKENIQCLKKLKIRMARP